MKKHKAFIITLITISVVSVYLKLRVYDPYLFYGPDIEFNPFYFIPESELIGIIIIVSILISLFLMTKVKRITEQRTRQRMTIFILLAILIVAGALIWSIVQPKPGDLITAPDGGEVINNEIILYLIEGTTEQDAQEFADLINGRIVGVINSLEIYQIEVNISTLEELDTLVAFLEGLNDPRIEAASLSSVGIVPA